MKSAINPSKLAFLLFFVAAVIGFSAFRQKDTTRKKPFRESYQTGSDDTTTRGKRNRPENEFNMDQLEKSMMLLDRHMAELEKQMEKIDLPKIKQQMEESMKHVDMEKINAQIDKAMASIDWSKLQNEQVFQQQQTMERVKKEMARAKKDMEKAREELKSQKFDFQFDAEKISNDVKQGMEKAKVGIEKAKEQLKNVEAFTNALQADGLIDKSKAYKIEVKDGELYLNGTKQSKEISEKYKSFYQKGNFVISNGSHAQRI